MLRFRQLTDRLKKGLMVNPMMPFEVQNLLDRDINFLVKREDFEARIYNLLGPSARPRAGVVKDDLFTIEVCGPAARGCNESGDPADLRPRSHADTQSERTASS
jgi:hypothetical protein